MALATGFGACKKKGAFGLPPCGDGICASNEPFVCPQDCGGIQISAGGEHTCTVKMADGLLWCWGHNTYGQLGNGTLQTTAVPVATLVDAPVDAVFCGDAHTCTLLKNDRSVLCWGKNDSGQLGDGSTTDSASPVAALGLDDIRLLTVGGAHTCALSADDGVWCWGWNEYGQLGVDPAARGQRHESTPIRVFGLPEVVRLSAGRVHTCALTRRGAVYCFGWNEYGQLGVLASLDYSALPVRVQNLGEVVSLSAGSHHTCAVNTSGAVFCWGDNEYCQLGLQDVAVSEYPRQVSALGDCVSVAASRMHTCTVIRDGTVHCFGANTSGQLGDGSTVLGSSAPVQVAALLDVVYINTGGYHTCAIESCGTLWCWGFNHSGRLVPFVFVTLSLSLLFAGICIQ